jgi:site-specific DNA recombinase
MIAAIYARKSTDQSGVADDQKSVARQIEHAHHYAQRKGWTIAEAHVYVDDGISGAEFANRPGYMRLLNVLKPRAPFDILIVSEVSRLGREQLETGYAMKQLAQAGIRIVSYLEDREVLLDTPTDKFLMTAVNFAAEIERENAQQRQVDAMTRKARAGHVTGGRVFGYDNVEVAGPDGRRSHVERRVNDGEAAVVRRIFDLCVAGHGYTNIAKTLNADRAPAPRAQRGWPAAWSPSSVNDVLHRELYRGVIVWNRSRKRDRWGQKHQRPRPAQDWIRVEAPGLRIISEDVWNAARQRLATIRDQLELATGGRATARRRDVDSRVLLSGFARCALCGGSFYPVSRSHGKRRAFFYACSSYHKRGTSVCGNGLMMGVDRIDSAVLSKLAGDVLQPEFVMAVVDGLVDAYAPERMATEIMQLQDEHERLSREISNLAGAIAAGGRLESLLSELKQRERRRETVAATIAARTRGRTVGYDRRRAERLAGDYLRRWRTLLTKHVSDARQALREVLEGPMRFTPEGKTYRFEGQVTFAQLFAGVVDLPPLLASPTGFEPVFWP